MCSQATTHHQHALRYAIRMSSLAGESLACGHLGALGATADVETSRACTERQLQLARTLHDARATEDAYLQLGVRDRVAPSRTGPTPCKRRALPM